MNALQPYASNALYAGLAIGLLDYLMDKNVKKALVIAVATAGVMYVANGMQLSTTVS